MVAISSRVERIAARRYTFLSNWALSVELATVFTVLKDLWSYPTWWAAFKRADRIDDENAIFVMRSALRLTFNFALRRDVDDEAREPTVPRPQSSTGPRSVSRRSKPRGSRRLRRHTALGGLDAPRGTRHRDTDGHLPRDRFNFSIRYPACAAEELDPRPRLHDFRQTNAEKPPDKGSDLRIGRDLGEDCAGIQDIQRIERVLYPL
jgi:hypothetical protein